MRIAMVGNFPMDPSRIPGGVEAVIKNLIIPLSRISDFDLHLISTVQGLKNCTTTNYQGTTIHYLPGQTRLGHLTDHILEQRSIAALQEELQPDLVHAHGTGRHVAAAQRTGFPLVITVHGIRYKEVVLFGGLKGTLRRWTITRLEKRVLTRARHIFTIAEYVRQAIAPMTRATFYPIANPVDAELFDLKTSTDGRTILSVAALQPRKGLLHLVEALAIVRREVPDARLQIIGKVLFPEYAEQLRARIKALDLQDVVDIRGFVPDEELREAFTRCAVFTLCSIEESSPVAIAEAMTLGKPVVATAVGGIPDLVADGKSGYLVPFGDVQAIALALGKILKNPELRRTFSAAARQRAEKDFHPSAIAAQTFAVYRSIIQPAEAQS